MEQTIDERVKALEEKFEVLPNEWEIKSYAERIRALEAKSRRPLFCFPTIRTRHVAVAAFVVFTIGALAIEALNLYYTILK